VLFQLGRHLNIDSYIDGICRDVIADTFTPENVELVSEKSNFFLRRQKS
jgi:hypothetical protein